MTILFYDSVNPGKIPVTASGVMGYIDGPYQWKTADWERFPEALKIGIATRATTNAGLMADAEKGDMSPGELVSWVKMRRAAEPTEQFGAYCSLNNWPSVKAAFDSAGIAQPWYCVAEWTTTLIPNGALGLQYKNTPDYDLSVFSDDIGIHVSTSIPGMPPIPVPAPPKPIGPHQYIVANGDTLSSIAAKFGVNWELIYQNNRGVIGNDPNKIFPGQVLNIPLQGKQVVYIVQPDDTLSSIARKYNTTWEELYRVNSAIIGHNPNIIYPGQRLVIP